MPVGHLEYGGHRHVEDAGVDGLPVQALPQDHQHEQQVGGGTEKQDGRVGGQEEGQHLQGEDMEGVKMKEKEQEQELEQEEQEDQEQ